MFVFTLAVIGGILLMFKCTRLTGVAGLTLIALAFPPMFLLFLVIGSIALLVHHKSK